MMTHHYYVFFQWCLFTSVVNQSNSMPTILVDTSYKCNSGQPIIPQQTMGWETGWLRRDIQHIGITSTPNLSETLHHGFQIHGLITSHMEESWWHPSTTVRYLKIDAPATKIDPHHVLTCLYQPTYKLDGTKVKPVYARWADLHSPQQWSLFFTLWQAKVANNVDC